MKDTGDSDDHSRRFYAERKPFFDKLVEEVRFVLEAKVEKSGVKLVGIDGRVKPLESFLEKITRKQYKDPHQVSDLAGVRVVCLYEPDLARVANIVAGVFDIDESIDKSELLGVDRMGYQGQHCIVRLEAGYAGPRYDDIRGLPCEIQIRTVLQDAWAQISHHLAYKTEASIPHTLRRAINNVSSLLEVAQEIFDRVRDLRTAYVEEVEAKKGTESDFLLQPIDHETLAAYTKWKFPALPVNTWLQEVLLADLDRTRFETLADIDKAMVSASESVRSYQRENPDWFKFGTDYLTKSLGFVDAGFRKKHGFAERTKDAFKRYADKVITKNDDA